MRDEIDATIPPIQCKTDFEVIADKWNDPTFNHTTTVSSCHPEMKLCCSTLRSNVFFLQMPSQSKTVCQAFEQHCFKLLTSGSRVVKETEVEWLKQVVIDLLAGAICIEEDKRLWISEKTSLLMHLHGTSISLRNGG